MEIMLFDEVYYRVDKNLIDIENGIEDPREAVRAIILNGNNILMAHLQKTNEYKFPGGGIKENESIEKALKREVLEEIGYIVKDINGKIGTIIEYSISKKGKEHYFKMISDYYLVEVDNIQLKQKLEKDEEELMYKPCWTNIREAYKTHIELIKNKSITTPGIYRETIALEKLIEKYQW